MIERRATIGSRNGLHARPAQALARAVTESGDTVTLSAPGREPVNARSLLALLSLGAAHGDEVTVSVTGENEATTADNVVTVLETDHD